ncbi:MAG: exo-alpha-sialidase [Phycisphaerae bacterium]
MKKRLGRIHVRRSTALQRIVYFSVLPASLLVGGCPFSPGSMVTLDAEGAGITNAPLGTLELAAARRTFPADSAMFAAQAIFDEIDGKAGSHAPSIVALARGERLAAWYSYSGPRELTGADLYTARWTPDAGTWSPPRRVVDRAQAVGNPVLHVEGERVLLFYAVIPGGWSTAHIEWQESQDAGETWSAPRVLSEQLGSNVRYPPIRLQSGSLVLPAYDDLLQHAVLFESKDEGESWQEAARIDTTLPAKLIQPSIVENADGTLLLVGRNTATGKLWTGMSPDGGTSWTISRDSGFPNPGAPAALARLSSGNLLLVWNDDAALRRPLVAALSFDGGRTWSSPRVLANGLGSYSYPSVAQADDGSVHVVYSDDRLRISHVEFNEAWLLAE